jgi:hypothetical protein
MDLHREPLREPGGALRGGRISQLCQQVLEVFAQVGLGQLTEIGFDTVTEAGADHHGEQHGGQHEQHQQPAGKAVAAFHSRGATKL